MSNKKFFFDLAVIFLFAFALRLGLLLVLHYSGQGAHLTGDSPSYLRVAESLSRGLGFTVDGQPSFRRGPAYPLFLAMTLQFGFPLFAHILQLVLDAIAAVFIYRIGCLLWSRKVGLLAGLSYGIHYYAIKQCVTIMPETLFVFFVVVSFYYYYQGRAQESHIKIFFAGLFATLAVLTKEVLFLYYIAWGMGALLLEGRKGRYLFSLPALFLLTYMLGLASWIVYGSSVQGKPTFLTNHTGLTLYLGNNPTVDPRLRGEDWTLKVNTANAPDVASDEVHKNAATQYIKTHPKIFIRNAFFKLCRFWYPIYSDSPKLIKFYCGLLYGFMMLFSVMGCWQNRKRWIELLPFWGMIVYLSCVHSITIASIRYRFVLEPFLLLLAAAAVSQIRLHFRLKTTKIAKT